MSKNINDINYLAAKQRVMAAIAGKGYPEAVSKSKADAFFPPAEAVAADDLAEEAYQAPQEAGAQSLSVPSPVTLAPGATVMAAYLASRVSPATRATMFAGLQRVARLLGTTPEVVPWHELRFEHTDAIRAKLLGGAYARSTVLVTLEALKGVLRQARRMGHLTRDQFDECIDWDRLGTESLPAGRELPQDEIEAIQSYIASLDGGPYGRFLEAAFALLLGTGLRAIEVCRATVAAYDTAGFIKIRRKGGKEAELPLGDPEARAINAWLLERKRFERRIDSPALLLRVHTNDWVRPRQPHCSEKYLYRMCQHVVAEAKVPHFSPHDLRRTFCTRALRVGDVLMVQTLMGHAKTDTTRKYDRRTLEERALARRSWNIWRPPEEKPEQKVVHEPRPTVGLRLVPPAND